MEAALPRIAQNRRISWGKSGVALCSLVASDGFGKREICSI